ncbi:MAG: FG-GAP repeat domain-containing protein, partial [Verrucomicrobiales bacterium]
MLAFGCSKKKETPTAESPLENPVESIVADGDTKETARLWSDAIKSEWAVIAEAMVDAEEVPAALKDGLAMPGIASSEQKEIFEGKSIKTVEIHSAETLVESSAEDFLAQLREVLCLATGDEESSVYFKLYGIDRNGELLKTRQRLMAHGTRDGKEVRSYGVVDASWKTPEDGTPRLVSFAMPTLIQNELLKPAAMFEDIAGDILGGNASWNEQLQLGMNTWRSHIDRSLNPDFLGYHGVAIADVDGDDLEDVYLCQPGGLPNLLFKQQPDGTLVDISKSARVDWLDNSTASLLVDLDNDGD